MNIVTWQIAHPDVNADNAVSLYVRVPAQLVGSTPRPENRHLALPSAIAR